MACYGVITASPAAALPSFTVDPPVVVASAAQRQAAGYTYGPEGVMGVVQTGPSAYSFDASNAFGDQFGATSYPARFTGSLDAPFATDPAGVEADDQIVMTNLPSDIHFAGVSKIYEAAGYWLTVVHTEKYFGNPPNSANGFYASLSMAKSTDNGATWTYLGEIVRHKATFQQCSTTAGADIGSGPWTIVNSGGVDYFYSYFFDIQAADCSFTGRRRIAVARASVSGVIAAANSNTVTSWVKYNNGWGSEPGLGGTSSDLNTDFKYAPNWYDVSFNSYQNKFILISTGCGDFSLNAHGNLCYRESSDGIVWSAKQTLLSFGSGFHVYPTVVGLGSLPGRTTGQQFYIYYFEASSAANAWVDGHLSRVRVTIA